MEKLIIGLLAVIIVLVIVYFYKRSRTKYDVDYFIAKFSAIPSDKWTTKEFKHEGKSCALGFCGMRSFGKLTKEARALGGVFGGIDNVWSINDGIYYSGGTPKDRILKRLGEIKMSTNKI